MEKSQKEATLEEMIEEARNMVEAMNYGIANEILEAVLDKMCEERVFNKSRSTE